MTTRGHKGRWWLVAVSALVLAALAPDEAEARVGGGHSYSGSSGSRSSGSGSFGSRSGSSFGSRSSSGGGSGRPATGFDFAIAAFVIGIGVTKALLELRAKREHQQIVAASRAASRPPPSAMLVARMRALDPTFSEPVFLEWAQLLFTRVHAARAGGDRDAIAPYLSEEAVRDLGTGPEGMQVTAIKGLLIGSAQLDDVSSGDPVFVYVRFRANWTAVLSGGSEQAFWVEERWRFARKRGVQSRPPELVERLGCPSCGAATERSSLGRCAQCGNSLKPGEYDWQLVRRHVLEVQRKPALLTGFVPEVGTDLPTIRQKGVGQRLAAMPPASQAHFDRRARRVFIELQRAWSDGELERLRPFESDALFSQHRFWLEQYRVQGLRNRLEELALTKLEICKVEQDAYYDAITCRMHAQARDFTVRMSDGAVVGGDAKRLRKWTEYWTFIRRRGAKEVESEVQCPSCTAPLQVTHTGVCAHCGTKLTRGDFDWVLSRIEQDEEYVG